MNSEVSTAGVLAASPGKKNWSSICLIGGIVFLAITLLGIYLGQSNGDSRPAFGLLIMFTFYLSIGLGMLLFTMIHHLFGSGWSTILRRQLEHGISIFPWLALIFVAILVINVWPEPGFIWKWFDADAVAHDVLYQKKTWWLSQNGFYIRFALYFGGWILLANGLRKASMAQDIDGNPGWTRKMTRYSAIGILFTALTLTAASIDWLKSLEFHWFSTMYGVWFFAASMRAALAATALVCIYQVYKNGPLTGLFKKDHMYDLGCVMLAFTVFWAYISFSQYFLVYNANIPEETFWYNMREQGAWWWVSMGLIFGHFLFPFLYLLFYGNKVKVSRMIFISIWVLSFHMLDLYFNILPSKRLDYDMYVSYPLLDHPVDFVWDLAAFLGIGGICAWSYMRSWRKTQLIPVKDPRILESLHHHGR